MRRSASKARARKLKAEIHPKDSQVMNVLGFKQRMVLAYQYRLEFFKLPHQMKLARAWGQRSPFVIVAHGKTIQRNDFKKTGLRPFKSMTFRHHIQTSDEFSGANYFPKFIWVCDDLMALYTPSDAEERKVVDANFPDYGGAMPWLNRSGMYSGFCGAISLEGKIIYRLPIRQHSPDVLVDVLHTSRNGLSVELDVGRLRKEVVSADKAVEDAPGQSVTRVHYYEHLIYTYPNTLEKFDDKDQQKIQQAMRKDDFF